jgi:hypothetical protein
LSDFLLCVEMAVVAAAHSWIFSAEEHAFGYYAIDLSAVSPETGLPMALEALESDGEEGRAPVITYLTNGAGPTAMRPPHPPVEAASPLTSAEGESDSIVGSPLVRGNGGAEDDQDDASDVACAALCDKELSNTAPLSAIGSEPPALLVGGGSAVFLHRRVAMGPRDAAVRNPWQLLQVPVRMRAAA